LTSFVSETVEPITRTVIVVAMPLYHTYGHCRSHATVLGNCTVRCRCAGLAVEFNLPWPTVPSGMARRHRQSFIKHHVALSSNVEFTTVTQHHHLSVVKTKECRSKSNLAVRFTSQNAHLVYFAAFPPLKPTTSNYLQHSSRPGRSRLNQSTARSDRIQIHWLGMHRMCPNFRRNYTASE